MDRTSKKPMTQTTTGDGLARGMEFALLTLLFLGIGYALDRWLDTKPIFMIVLVVVALIGQFASLWYGYDAQMRQHETARVAAIRQGKPATRKVDGLAGNDGQHSGKATAP